MPLIATDHSSCMFPIQWCPSLQLALHRCSNLYERFAVAETDLAAINLGLKYDLLEAILVDLAGAPRRSDELVARLYRASEAGLVFFKVGGVAATEGLEQVVGGGVPAVKTVNDLATEAHLLSRFRSGVERIVVAV